MKDKKCSLCDYAALFFSISEEQQLQLTMCMVTKTGIEPLFLQRKKNKNSS
jgi:hypothetical protein